MCRPRMKVRTRATAERMRNVILLNLRLGSTPFLNFIENIGISLTSRSDRIIEAAGMIHVLCVTGPAMFMMSILQIVANDPQSMAQAGVARPIKFSLCLSSTLNLASLRAEKTTMSKGT